MCSGASPAVCTMNSPRSVSTTSTPAASRRSFRPISSAAIDLPLTTIRPWRQDDLGDVGRRIGARRRPGGRRHPPPRASPGASRGAPGGRRSHATGPPRLPRGAPRSRRRRARGRGCRPPARRTGARCARLCGSASAAAARDSKPLTAPRRATVARWTTLTPARMREARPSICITQPGSALATTPAETAAAEASLSSAIAVDTSG